MFKRTKTLDAFGDARYSVFLVAGSFEPRSVRATALMSTGVFSDSIIFDYEDTLDNAIGRHHVEQLKSILLDKTGRPPFVLKCRFGDPYSVVRSLVSLLNAEERLHRTVDITVDATCFTKIHLLLLLKYIADQCEPNTIRICYTEPLTYATAFKRQLSYGIERTVYLPYQVAPHSSKGIGLVAFMGHERFRLERILQELEPDISIVILGEPGFSLSMLDYSRRVNATLIHRAEYDGHYCIISAPANDTVANAEVLKNSIIKVRESGCDTVYIVTLGTKLQAVSVELLRLNGVEGRLLLGYSIPKSYERNMYSQGNGPTYVGVLPTKLVLNEPTI